MGGNTISRGNVRFFSKNRTDVQLFCGNSAEHIFCLQDRICLQDRFWHLIIIPVFCSCSVEILQNSFLFAGQNLFGGQILTFDNLPLIGML
jgi:hypothetical protein